MRKRKRKPLYVEEKLIAWQGRLPKSLWIYLGQFLREADFFNTFLNHYFAQITLKWLTDCYKKRFVYFPLHFDHSKPYTLDLLKELNLERKLYKSRYYTLYNPAYIELFLLVENKKSKEAQAFIASRLGKEKSLTDIIFTQKDAKGNTVITIADRLGLQDFLDYCFDQLIVNRPLLDLNDCLIQTGEYSHTLSQLDFKMSNAALWIYGCARVCNQQTICDAFSDKPAWNPQYVKKGKESLLMIAAWLGGVGSVRLAEEIRSFEEVVGVGDISYQQFESKVNYGHLLTHHHNYDSYFAIDIAAISKNKNMINFIGHYEHSAELLCFYIEQKDFHGLKACLDNNYEDDIAGEPAIWGYLQSPTAQCNTHFNIDYAHELLPIDLAIIKNWLEGVQLILERGFSANLKFPYFNSLYLAIDFERTEIAKLLLVSKADPNFTNPEIKQAPAIFRAIQKNNLGLVRLLVENKASVEIENKMDPIHRYPLVSAALNQNAEVTQYLVKSTHPLKAMEQLWNVSAFFKSRPHKQQILLKELYDDVAKENPFSYS